MLLIMLLEQKFSLFLILRLIKRPPSYSTRFLLICTQPLCHDPSRPRREFSANIKKLNAGQQSVDETLEKVRYAYSPPSLMRTKFQFQIHLLLEKRL
jgi:hypothetical protein